MHTQTPQNPKMLSNKHTKLKSRHNNIGFSDEPFSDEPFSDEPVSPEVSCIGRVKRNITTNHKKIVPTLSPAATAAVAGGGRSKSCKCSKGGCLDKLKRLNLKKECEQEHVEVIDIGKLDPPLPVVKRAAPSPEVNLWRRRMNGAELEKVEIIHESLIYFEQRSPARSLNQHACCAHIKIL